MSGYALHASARVGGTLVEAEGNDLARLLDVFDGVDDELPVTLQLAGREIATSLGELRAAAARTVVVEGRLDAEA